MTQQQKASEPLVLPAEIGPAQLLRWLRAAGESLRQGDPLVVVLSERAEIVLPALAGVLEAQLVAEGAELAPGALLAEFAPASALPGAGERAVLVTPAARALARATGLELAGLQGSGADGRVIRRDVELALDGAPAAGASARDGRTMAAPGALAAAADGVSSNGRPAVSRVDGTAVAAQLDRGLAPHGAPQPSPRSALRPGRAEARGQALHQPLAQPARPSQAQPFQPGGTSAPQTSSSTDLAGDPRRPQLLPWAEAGRRTGVAVVPQLMAAVELDLSAYLALRSRVAEPYARRGLELTLPAYVATGLLAILPQHPLLAMYWHDQELVRRARPSLAFVLPSHEGTRELLLASPSDLNLQGLARALGRVRERDSVEAGRQGAPALTIVDASAGGALLAAPRISLAHSPVLQIGAARKVVAALDDGGIERIALRTACVLSLTADARVIGLPEAEAALAALRRQLEGGAG